MSRLQTPEGQALDLAETVHRRAEHAGADIPALILTGSARLLTGKFTGTTFKMP